MQLAQQPLVPGVERDAAAQELLEGVSSLVRAVRCIEHRHLTSESGLRRSDASVLKVLMKDGRMKPSDTVVVFNTGGALKYLDALPPPT